jgi:Schlafen, AlbA_2
MQSNPTQVSASRRRRGSSSERATAQLLADLRNLVDELALTTEVTNALLPSGIPHDFEGALWDYKRELPILPKPPTEDDSRRYKAEIGDLIKDAAAFHNAFGGYIVFGVADKGATRLVGCAAEFDCGDFNKRLQGYTDTNIECLFRTIPLSEAPDALKIGLLLVPRRATGAPPVRFRKKGPEKLGGGRCFSEETYVRIRDECRPATATSEDWLYLHSDRTPPDRIPASNRRKVKSHLPVRDPDLIEFLGAGGSPVDSSELAHRHTEAGSVDYWHRRSG